MKKHRNLIYYLSVISFFLIIIYSFLSLGKSNLEIGRDIKVIVSESTAWSHFIFSVIEEATGPVALLLLQIIVILLFVKIFGWICQKIGQPTVIGEILAGIVLGPSLLGAYFPEISNVVFPESSISNIKLLSEIGLILFMYIVGMELDLKVLKNRLNDAVIISHSSIAFLFALGIILSYFIYPYFTHENAQFTPFALFMGISMSITAFPVLARIVHERGLNKKPLGAMVITCAAVDDITAWCLLAAVIAIAKAGTFTSSIFVIISAVIYVIFMFKLVRPFLERVANLRTSRHIINKSVVGIFFLVLFMSSYITSIIGIHPLFGAFLAGVIMPTNINFRKLFVEKIEDVSLVVLLPLFFVYTGLNTKIGLLNTPSLWALCGIIILIASFGKVIGGSLTARYIGFDWKSSLTIGTLMNTRGLMELVVLNIGYDLGILTPEVFAMMVVMALVTTFMTSPGLNIIDRIFKNRKSDSDVEERKVFKVLIPFQNSEVGKKLLLIASAFTRREKAYTNINMLYVSEGDTFYQHDMEDEEKDLFDPIKSLAEEIDQSIETTYELASDIDSKVVKIANKDNYDFLLLGVHDSIYRGNIIGRFLGFSNRLLYIPKRIVQRIAGNARTSHALNSTLDDKIQSVIAKSDMPTGIFIDRGLKEIKNVFVPILDEDDMFITEFVERLIKNSYTRITVWDSIGLMDESIEFSKSIREIKSINPYLFQLWNNKIPLDKDIIGKQDLVMISLKSWNKLRDQNMAWTKSIHSTLLMTE